MDECPISQSMHEITNEFKLLSRSILVKLKPLFHEVDLPYSEQDFVITDDSEDRVNLSFLIPFETKFKMENDKQNPHEYAREFINQTLKVLAKNFKYSRGCEIVECNLKYTGFSISPFGFVMSLPKDRLGAVAIRKTTTEIIASLEMNEIKKQAILEDDMSLKLPGDIVFAGLHKRREIAEQFEIGTKEYDLRAIDDQICNVKSLLKMRFQEISVIAS